MKITSAYANKLLKQLNEEKDYWVRLEAESCFYDAAEGETPVIPEYDYESVRETIRELDRKTVVIKHALNKSNALAEIPVNGRILSVDEILVTMAQLTNRKYTLDSMRRRLPKERLQLRAVSGTRNAVPEYRFANYDIEIAKQDFDRISEEILQLQMALDLYNQTEQFEVEL